MKDPERRIVQAAGGLVQDEQGGVLFMFRRNVWDLPKGKRDPGEDLEACAVREVKEETGIRDIELKEFLLVTRHTYEENGEALLKETHWYRMKAPAGQVLVPQLEEDITELRWIPQSGFDEVKENTYPTILAVLETGGYKIS